MRLDVLTKTQTVPYTHAPHLYTITPKMARQILEHNYEGNRKLRNGVVAAYANDMTNEKWTAGSPDMIVIGRDGKLYNGQNRLNAVIKSNTTQTFWVLEEADPSLYNCMDNGLKRRTSDYVKGPNAGIVTTLAGIFYAMTAGTSSIGNCLGSRVSRNVSSTREDILEIANDDTHNNTFQNYIQIAHEASKRTQKKFKTQIAIALMLIDKLNQTDKFNEFIAEMKTISPANNIITMLRQNMMSNAKRTDRSDQRTYIVGLILTAYKMYDCEKELSEAQIKKEFKKYQHTLDIYNDLLTKQREIAWANAAA